MEYKETLDWLFSRLPMFSRIGAPAYKPGLQTTETLDRLYGHPHTRYKTIHVAGTNGKGSTSHMIAAVLQAAGYKTGLYTSPHLVDFRERMRINGKMIPRERVVEFVKEWRNKQETPEITNDAGTEARNISPSFFELTMMMAFDWFARENVDYAVIEVGMGGRLDSTNVITPQLSVITNISYDHTQFLGNTLEEIAGEKAGIIKKGIPVVIGEAEGNVKKVFEEKARAVGAPIYFAQNDNYHCSITISPLSGHKTSESITANLNTGWGVKGAGPDIIHISLAGAYQKHNIRTVLCALEVLRKLGVNISDKQIKAGLENVAETTGLRGRWQILASNPTIICDTGHNYAGLSENMAALNEISGDRKLTFVLGFVNDKDVSNIVRLFPENATYFFTQASIPRAMKAEDVARNFATRGIDGKIIGNVREAYETALKEAPSDSIVYIGGSTFVVADLLDVLERRNRQ